jgi:hypothetical protein
VTQSPNGNPVADAMASTIAHELEESATDPNLDAWYTQITNLDGTTELSENADKCAWNFGQTYQTTNGATANMMLGKGNFLIQQNWVNDGGGYCARGAPASFLPPPPTLQSQDIVIVIENLLN